MNKISWTVTSQSETNRTNATGQFVSGVLVAYQTDTGIAGQVFVPDSKYNPQSVADAINIRVAQHDAVSNLKG